MDRFTRDLLAPPVPVLLSLGLFCVDFLCGTRSIVFRLFRYRPGLFHRRNLGQGAVRDPADR